MLCLHAVMSTEVAIGTEAENLSLTKATSGTSKRQIHTTVTAIPGKCVAQQVIKKKTFECRNGSGERT